MWNKSSLQCDGCSPPKDIHCFVKFNREEYFVCNDDQQMKSDLNLPITVSKFGGGTGSIVNSPKVSILRLKASFQAGSLRPEVRRENFPCFHLLLVEKSFADNRSDKSLLIKWTSRRLISIRRLLLREVERASAVSRTREKQIYIEMEFN